LFAKFSSDSPSVRASMHAVGIYEREVRFYQHVAAHIALRTPRCYFAAVDVESGCSLLLLEDLAGGRSGDSLAGCSTRDAELILRQIAGLHAQWWDHPAPREWKWLPGYDGEAASRVVRIRRAWPLFLERYAEVMPAWAIGAAERILGRMFEIFGAIALRPQTLTHGDLGLDNVRFDLPDAPLAIFDWNTMWRLPGPLDVSWFLVRSLPTAQRRNDEERLLRAYHDALVAAGVRDYPMETLRRDTRLGVLRAFLAVINSGANAEFSSERGRQVIRARIERNVAAIEDYGLSDGLW
jgi:hypothetical protein